MKKKALVLLPIVIVAASAAASMAYDEGDVILVGPVVKFLKSTVGTVVSVKEEEVDGKKTGTVELQDESGETKIFPIDATVKVVDGALGAITFSDLKKGQKVAVEQAQTFESNGKVETIKVVK